MVAPNHTSDVNVSSRMRLLIIGSANHRIIGRQLDRGMTPPRPNTMMRHAAPTR
jgi:hypothetical protein